MPTPPRWTHTEHPWLPGPPVSRPSRRVIIDNDFAGDPDDLYQLVHHLLSPAVEVPLIVASHLRPGDPFDPGPHSAAHAVERVHEVLDAMGLRESLGDRVVVGAEEALVDTATPQPAPAVDAIIAEALKDDDRPLYYAAGGGLTDLASALLVEPRVAERLVLVWIGGPEHPGLAVPPPDADEVEYNLAIDVEAARVVFGHSSVPLWLVPRDRYRQCLVSEAELRTRIAPHGPTGALLHEAIQRVAVGFGEHTGAGQAETYALGDSPLVLLTALLSFFQPDSSSSDHVLRPAPTIDERGVAHHSERGRTIRVYTHLDVRLMFEDMFAKVAALARWQASAGSVS